VPFEAHTAIEPGCATARTCDTQQSPAGNSPVHTLCQACRKCSRRRNDPSPERAWASNAASHNAVHNPLNPTPPCSNQVHCRLCYSAHAAHSAATGAAWRSRRNRNGSNTATRRSSRPGQVWGVCHGYMHARTTQQIPKVQPTPHTRAVLYVQVGWCKRQPPPGVQLTPVRRSHTVRCQHRESSLRDALLVQQLACDCSACRGHANQTKTNRVMHGGAHGKAPSLQWASDPLRHACMARDAWQQHTSGGRVTQGTYKTACQHSHTGRNKSTGRAAVKHRSRRVARQQGWACTTINASLETVPPSHTSDSPDCPHCPRCCACGQRTHTRQQAAAQTP
jgi:hypothetical protein